MYYLDFNTKLFLSILVKRNIIIQDEKIKIEELLKPLDPGWNNDNDIIEHVLKILDGKDI